MLLAGDTPDAEKRKIFSNLDKALFAVDVVIYTPVMSAGNSIELTNAFQHVFAAFVEGSCIAETCMQMLARFRFPTSGSHYILIQNVPNKCSLPVTSEDVAAHIGKQNIALVGAARDMVDVESFGNSLHLHQLEIDKNGFERIVPLNTFAATVFCANVALENQSRGAFAQHLVELCGSSGVICKELICNNLEHKTLLKIAKLETQHTTQMYTQSLINTIDITIEGAKDLEERHGNLSAEDFLVLARCRLLEKYILPSAHFRKILSQVPDQISFVQKMLAARTQLWFRLLQFTISRGGNAISLGAHLVAVHGNSVFQLRNQYADDPDAHDLAAISYACVAQNQQNTRGFALGCAKLLAIALAVGFPGIFTHEPLLLSEVELLINMNRELIAQFLSDASEILCVRAPSYSCLQCILTAHVSIATNNALTALSSLLFSTYGASVMIFQYDDEVHHSAKIVMNSLFSFNDDNKNTTIPIRAADGSCIRYPRVGNGIQYRKTHLN